MGSSLPRVLTFRVTIAGSSSTEDEGSAIFCTVEFHMVFGLITKTTCLVKIDFMKYALIILSGLGLILASCKQPAEVELDGVGQENEFEVISLDQGDSDVPVNQVDSVAVLAEDQLNFAGLFIVNNVKVDNGRSIRDFAFSKAFVADLGRPIIIPPFGRRVGHFGVFLGNLTLNDLPMTPTLHRIRIRRAHADTTIVAGFEYFRDLTSDYQANQTYVWRSDSAGAGVSIQSPAELSVLSPRGGSVILRNRVLRLRWSGVERVFVIISAREASTERLKPVLLIRPTGNQNSVVLSPKVLRLLPRSPNFVFTFVRANRKELSIGGPVFSGEILVQAASVYNSYVELR